MAQTDKLPQHLLHLKKAFASPDNDDIVSLIAYGSALYANENRSLNPVQLLIVLKEVEFKSMRRLRNVYASLDSQIQISPMLATVEELMTSTDVFPITFLEMKRSYQVLSGEDVLKDLDISEEYLRLRCEQELKNLLLRMQTAFFKQSDFNQVNPSFRTFWKSFIRSLGASLILVGEAWPENTDETLKIAAAEFQLNETTLSRTQMVADGKLVPEPEVLEQVWLASIDNIAIAARFVDQLPVHCTTVEILDPSENT